MNRAAALCREKKKMVVRRILLWLLLALCGAAAHAQPALVLRDGSAAVDAWPALRVLEDPAGRLEAGQALARLEQFAPPDVKYANFGPRHGAMWLWLPLVVPAGESGQWLVDLDYPTLDDVQVWRVVDGKPVFVARQGDHLPAAERPPGLRAIAVPLALEPGREHALLLRVATASTMVLPLRLARPDVFQADEMRTQALQGLAAGIGLCLLIYSLACYVSVRDRIFLGYGLNVAGITSYFIAHHGLGAQHLWGWSDWLTHNAAPWSVLFAIVGGCLFLDRVLQVKTISRTCSRLLHAVALAAVVVALAFPLGLIDYRTAQTAATALGPLPMLLGAPLAFVRARGGDRAAAFLLVGWAAYGVGALSMAAILRGLVDATPSMRYTFQVAALFEMVLWLFVLGVRAEELRQQAAQSRAEQQRLHSLAQTDALTGLPNRRGLEAALAAALGRADAHHLVAVYLIDLDGFKAINDRLGHDAGDALLVGVASRLKGCARASDVVARLGGDEFVVVAAPLPSDADAQTIGRKLLKAFDAPFEIVGEQCRVGLTIGYALAPHDGCDASGLLKRADAAMYAGKQSGRRQLRRGAASFGLAGAG